MAVGFGLLRLSPDVFWAMTPVEFAHAAGVLAPGRRAPPNRAELASLMSAFPDTPAGSAQGTTMEDRQWQKT